jgi:hypothetical protein
MQKITISMDNSALAELEAEIGIKNLMKQLSPRQSIIDRIAIGYLQAAADDCKSITIEGPQEKNL